VEPSFFTRPPIKPAAVKRRPILTSSKHASGQVYTHAQRRLCIYPLRNPLYDEEWGGKSFSPSYLSLPYLGWWSEPARARSPSESFSLRTQWLYGLYSLSGHADRTPVVEDQLRPRAVTLLRVEAGENERRRARRSLASGGEG